MAVLAAKTSGIENQLNGIEEALTSTRRATTMAQAVGSIGDLEAARRLVPDRLHGPVTVMTRSACARLSAITTALSWSVVRAQAAA
jgi:hypothetical protein